ncbi:transcription factor TGA2.2 isoform X2 [Magnolia sinica]|uniref:transcription factor TGA2.2 isoform X2 n=1 Tax=Magnolia sinica TaxID=86752 RepID=UPI0026596E1F|nr:transcription factor TGA2.2 isoform X2 [Magnolia sinica]
MRRQFFSCMAGNRVGAESGLSDSGPSNQHITYGILHGIAPPPSTNLFDQHGSAYEFGELEEALMPKLLQGAGIRSDEDRKSFFSIRPPTLEIFPSWPMRYQQTQRSAESTDSGSAQNTVSHLEPESPISKKASDQSSEQPQQQPQQAEMASDASRSGPPNQIQPKTTEKRKGGDKTLDAKTLRRLAQNREAARKSRLRKKAYVQQLETSRIKLTQLEQDLQRARSQGLFMGGGGGGAAGANISSGAAIFDVEYARWLEEDHRHMSELRAGLQAHLSDSDLRFILDGCLSHYDEIFRLKGVAAKADVFHLITGMWTTPAERCFLWMGGFRPSELLKILIPQLDPLTDQQLMGICSLQQSSQQAEEALSQGLDQLQHSLTDTIASGSLSEGTNVADYMGHMTIALGKLSNLEGFVRQADNLRQQTLHQMPRILTVRQAARCFLAIGEYYSRLRALSSLWSSRPRESMIVDDNVCQTSTDLQMVQSAHNHFSSF